MRRPAHMVFFNIITYFFKKVNFIQLTRPYGAFPRPGARTKKNRTGPRSGPAISGSKRDHGIWARVSKNFAYGGFGAKFGPAACVSGPAKKPGRKNRG